MEILYNGSLRKVVVSRLYSKPFPNIRNAKTDHQEKKNQNRHIHPQENLLMGDLFRYQMLKKYLALAVF